MGSNPTPTAVLLTVNLEQMTYSIEVKQSGKYCYINAINEFNNRIGKLGIEFTEDYPRYSEYCNGKKMAKIVYVMTDLPYCGRGVASELLNTAIEFFENEYNLYLNVIPMPRKGESLKHRTVKGLIEFYGKFGFIRCNSDTITTTMIRKASLPTLGEK